MEKSKVSVEQILEKIDKLPKVGKIAICVLSLALVIGGFVYLSYLDKFEKIKELEGELEKVEQELSIAKRKANELPKVEKQIKKAEAEFKIAKRALPEKEEIPQLLTDITHKGQDSGLEFVSFTPGLEKKQDFYSDIPIEIEVFGRYHSYVLFCDKIARLNRIVNVKDIQISRKPKKKKKDGQGAKDMGKLNISCTAVTYKFLDVPVVVPDASEKKK